MYFGNFVTTVSTVLLILTFGYIVSAIRKVSSITEWGRRIAFLSIFGLVVCCFVAVRDKYHLSVQASIDGSVDPGIFAIESIQSTICCIGGSVIGFSVLSSIFVKNQKYRKRMFLLLSAMIMMKTFIIEISRWMM